MSCSSERAQRAGPRAAGGTQGRWQGRKLHYGSYVYSLTTKMGRARPANLEKGGAVKSFGPTPGPSFQEGVRKKEGGARPEHTEKRVHGLAANYGTKRPLF